MKTATYPQIGAQVQYVRQNAAGETVRGTAMVLAVCLDHGRRLMAHVVGDVVQPDGSVAEQKFNVDISCLNPSDDFVKRFSETTMAVRELSAEGNRLAQEIVAQYNEKVEELYSGLLGVPVEIERVN